MSSFESNPYSSLIIFVTSIFFIWAQEFRNFDLLSKPFLIGYWPSYLILIGGDLVSTAKKILAVEVFKKRHSQNKFLAVEVFRSRHSQKKLLAVEVFWVTKKWLWKIWNLILAVESVRTDHVIGNLQRKLRTADDIRIIYEKEIFEKSSVTPKVRIKISGGLSSTISSYNPLFRCYRYFKSLLTSRGQDWKQLLTRIKKKQNVRIVNKMFFKIFTYKTLYFIYK